MTESEAVTRQQRQRLEEMASRVGVSLEELITVAGPDIATETDALFCDVTARLLRKNAEAYRRLA